MWKLAVGLLFLAPTLAMADECRYQDTVNQAMDLDGVRVVEIRLGHHELHLNGSSDGKASIGGRACASSEERLSRLHLSQRRAGDRLVIDADNDSSGWSINLFGWSNYAYFDLQVQLPRNLPVELSVGSGDAYVAGVESLDSHVGSGDLNVKDITDRFSASVGSGDIVVENVGAVHLSSVGSGDFDVQGVRGDVSIGSIGSGDAGIRDVGGDVVVDSIGSGDLTVNGVGHDLRVRHVGSGDISHRHVVGEVELPRNH